MRGYKGKSFIRKDIESLKKKMDWLSLTQKYFPSQIAENLGYEKGMRLANNIVCSNFRDDDLIKYAINIILSIKKLYPIEWSKDWKNAVFLSSIYTIVWEYEESYKILLEAYERAEDPPATLTFELANCYNYPPEFDLMSEKDVENFLKKSLEKELTYEAAVRLRDIYKAGHKTDLWNYYENMAKEAERRNKHIEDLSPDVLAKE